MKVCSRCKQEKQFDEFCKDKSKKAGLRANCKTCDAIYYNANKDKRNKYLKLNFNKIKERKKQYSKSNVDRIKRQQKEYQANRKANDVLFKFSGNIRALICDSFKRNKTRNYKKQTKTEILLGCTIPELRDHLEKQFQPGMTFENHGEWQIDHVIPLASAKTQEEIEKLCHYTNLQPLWAIDNIKKGNKLTYST